MENDVKSTVESTNSEGQAPISDKVPVKQKIAYGLGSWNDMWGNWMYMSVIWPVFNGFLHVSPKMIGLVLMINRLIDAVSDPFFGNLSDNARSKFGRRRPFILIGSIAAGLFFPVLFMVGRDWSEMQMVWYMIGSTAIFITLVSCFNMPYQALGSELTPSYNERTSIYSYHSFIQKMGEIANFGAAAFITLGIFNMPDGNPDMLKGMRVYATIIGLGMAIIGFILFFVVKERYYEKLAANQEKISLADSLWKTLNVRPFLIMLISALTYGVAASVVGALGYYVTVFYVCEGDWALGSKWNLAMGIGGVALVSVGIPIFSAIAKRMSKRNTMILVQVIAILVFASTWVLYTPKYPWMQVIAAGLIFVTQASFWMLYGSIGGDVIDYDELKNGKRREGSFTSCGSWIIKVGLALGMLLSGWVLEWTGYDSHLGAQPVEVLTNMRLALAGIPITGLVISIFALSRFPLSPEKMKDVRKQLEAKRGEV